MKKTIRLTENDLHRVIKESVEAYLMEVQGWTLQKGDITWVNSVDAEDEQEYYSDKKNYKKIEDDMNKYLSEKQKNKRLIKKNNSFYDFKKKQ